MSAEAEVSVDAPEEAQVHEVQADVPQEVTAEDIGFEEFEEVQEGGEDWEENDEGQDTLIDGTVIGTSMVIVEGEPENAQLLRLQHLAGSQCSHCNKVFPTKQQQQAHIRKEHMAEGISRRNHLCTICNKSFTTSSNLQQHRRLHFNERPFQCSQCNKGFATSTNLKQHFRTHTGDRPYACNYCSKRFATNSNLRQHIRIHTADIIAESAIQASVRNNPDGSWHVGGPAGVANLNMIPAICLQQYICNICNKVYSNSSNLAQHKRTIHPQDFLRRYLCDYCSKTFSLVTNLRRHQKRTCPFVQRESPPEPQQVRQEWRCEECGKICSTKGNLKTHRFTHMGMKPYQCFICEKRFTTNSNLKQHLIVHDGKYNGITVKKKKPVSMSLEESVNTDNEEEQGNETTSAVRNLQEDSLELDEEDTFDAPVQTVRSPQPPPTTGRTQKPLIIKLSVDTTVSKELNTPKSRPILLPPPSRSFIVKRSVKTEKMEDSDEGESFVVRME